MSKISYALSFFLHSIIIFFFFYLVKTDKPIELYNQIIDVKLETLTTNYNESKKVSNVVEKKIDKKNHINDVLKSDNLKKKSLNVHKDTIKIPIEKKVYQKPKDIIQDTYNTKKEFENKKSKNKEVKNSVKKNTHEENKIFKEYNDQLKALIQKRATQNYPRISIRKKEEGIVELNFSIDMNGNIFNILLGRKTNASERLINSSIKTLNLISPYKKNMVLKKKNTFSIFIVYKLE